MAKPKCGYCNRRTAKRYCPALDKLLCPQCCGSNRLKNILCDRGCRYLDNEVYQQSVREERELRAALQDIPHSEHNDIFKNSDVKRIAYAFESFFADCYVKGLFNLTDQKIKVTLSNIYFHKFKGKLINPDEFSSLTMQVYDYLIGNEESEDLIGRVMLRIIISVNNMTGSQFGPYGYLNYLKNNLHPDVAGSIDGDIIETKDGKKEIFSKIR